MFYLVNTIVRLLLSLVWLLQWMIVIRALMSWFPQVQQSRIYDFVYTLTEPIEQPFRTLCNRIDFLRSSPVDISPILAIVALGFVQRVLYMIF